MDCATISDCLRERLDPTSPADGTNSGSFDTNQLLDLVTLSPRSESLELILLVAGVHLNSIAMPEWNTSSPAELVWRYEPANGTNKYFSDGKLGGKTKPFTSTLSAATS